MAVLAEFVLVGLGSRGVVWTGKFRLVGARKVSAVLVRMVSAVHVWVCPVPFGQTRWGLFRYGQASSDQDGQGKIGRGKLSSC